MKCDMWLKSVIVWLFRLTIYCAPRKVSVGFGGKDIYVENRTLLGGCSVSKGVHGEGVSAICSEGRTNPCGSFECGLLVT